MSEPNDGVTPTVGIGMLSLSQLENRLQLAASLRQQLFERRSVCRHDMKVAVESLGLELPSRHPLNSFTQAPSQVNFLFAYKFIQTEEEELIEKVRVRTRLEIKELLDQITSYITRPLEPFEIKHSRLKIVSKYLVDYQIPNESANETAQSELKGIAEVMQEWRRYQQLGQDVITSPPEVKGEGMVTGRVTLPPYQLAMNLLRIIGAIISSEFLIEKYDDESAFFLAIEHFTSQVRVSKCISPDPPWTPNELVEHTTNFIDSYTGPLPYKLQEEMGGVQRLLMRLDGIDDQRTLTSLKLVVEAVRNYVSSCRLLEEICISAVDTSISVCKHAGYMRTLIP